MTSAAYKRQRATYRANAALNTDLTRARGRNAALRLYGLLAVLTVLAIVAAAATLFVTAHGANDATFLIVVEQCPCPPIEQRDSSGIGRIDPALAHDV
jgi:hypothetical protein